MAFRVGLRRLLHASNSITRTASSITDVHRASAIAGSLDSRLQTEIRDSKCARAAIGFQTRSFCSKDVELVSKNGEEVAEENPRKVSPRHDLAMLFTCNVCETRSAKTMSRATYETGIVIVRCPSCRNLHLIADRLGWFGEPGSVEDFLSQQGVSVRTGVEATYEFSVDDLAGWTPPPSPTPQ